MLRGKLHMKNPMHVGTSSDMYYMNSSISHFHNIVVFHSTCNFKYKVQMCNGNVQYDILIQQMHSF